MRKLSLCQTGVLIVLTSILCIVLVIDHRQQTSSYRPDTEGSSEKTVPIQKLLSFLSDCASIPPVVPSDETCQYKPLPR